MIKFTSRSLLLLAGIIVVAVAGISFALQPRASESFPLAELPQHTHVHGIAVDRQNPSHIFLAKHHGFFAVAPDGIVTRVSETRDDFMGFTPHPTDPSIFYASGHPERGGNTGFIVSRDGGQSWTQLSPGANGPVDFHQMDVSKVYPNVIYGAYRGLQVSRDGGQTWEIVGSGPASLIDLAASAKDPDTLYAATEAGLQISIDAGQSWQATRITGKPVSLVEVTEDGRIFAFVLGTGLIRGEEGSSRWETLSDGFGDRIPIHLAIDPSDPDRLYLVTQHSEVLASEDRGTTWRPFGHTS